MTHDTWLWLTTPFRWLRCYLALPFYFWLPCPRCGHHFGGWEFRHSINGHGVCNRTACREAARSWEYLDLD